MWQAGCTGGCRYAAPLYVDITKRVVTRAPDAAEQEQQQDELEEYPKVFIGEVRLSHFLATSLLCCGGHAHEHGLKGCCCAVHLWEWHLVQPSTCSARWPVLSTLPCAALM